MRRIFIPALTHVFLILVFLLCFSKALANEDDKKAEKGHEDDEGQDQASEGRGQGPPPPEQLAQGQIQGLEKILNSDFFLTPPYKFTYKEII